jgi:hypothetical protein
MPKICRLKAAIAWLIDNQTYQIFIKNAHAHSARIIAQKSYFRDVE